MSSYTPVTDLEWQALEPLFPKPLKRGRGKPHTPWRAVVNAILFVLRTGSKWSALPKDPVFSSKSAAHRWFVVWDKSGLLDQILAVVDAQQEQSARLTFPVRRQRVSAPVESVEAPAVSGLFLG
jgi:transposase